MIFVCLFDDCTNKLSSEPHFMTQNLISSVVHRNFADFHWNIFFCSIFIAVSYSLVTVCFWSLRCTKCTGLRGLGIYCQIIHVTCLCTQSQLAQCVSSTMAQGVQASLSHKFDVSRLDAIAANQFYYGDTASVTDDNVNIGLRLFIRPADCRLRFDTNLGFYLQYVEGPQQNIDIEYELFVMDERMKKISMIKDSSSFTKWITNFCGGIPCVLPRKATDLKAMEYLTQEDTILHLVADVSIPRDAFAVKTNQRDPVFQPRFV